MLTPTLTVPEINLSAGWWGRFVRSLVRSLAAVAV
jgi:hypothetical protein